MTAKACDHKHMTISEIGQAVRLISVKHSQVKDVTRYTDLPNYMCICADCGETFYFRHDTAPLWLLTYIIEANLHENPSDY